MTSKFVAGLIWHNVYGVKRVFKDKGYCTDKKLNILRVARSDFYFFTESAAFQSYREISHNYFSICH